MLIAFNLIFAYTNGSFPSITPLFDVSIRKVTIFYFTSDAFYSTFFIELRSIVLSFEVTLLIAFSVIKALTFLLSFY